MLAMVAGAGAHHVFELGAGTGLMLQRELGLPGAVGTWVVMLPALVRAGWQDPPPAAVGVAAGANLAACLVHFTLWPSRLADGVPVLTEAEGLPAAALPQYNAILLGWGAASAVAAIALANTGQSCATLAGFLLALPLRHHARRHFAWVGEQARRHPAWWNRARAVR